MIRPPPRSTRVRSSAASDVYKRQHITHPVVVRGGRPDGAAQRLARGTHPRQDALVVQDVEHRGGGRHRDLVARERGEEDRVPREALRDVATGDQGPDRLAVSHRLAQGHHVRLDAEPVSYTHLTLPTI